MKEKIIRTVIVGIIMSVAWVLLSRYIGFENTVLIALAIIFGWID